MKLAMMLEVIPYLVIALICLGMLIDWMRKSIACQKALKGQIERSGLKLDPETEKHAPSQVSPVFISAVVAVLFAAFLFVAARTVIENSRLRHEIALQRKLLVDMIAEKRSFNRDTAKLKSEIGELRAQKALYTATLETLAKKDGTGR